MTLDRILAISNQELDAIDLSMYRIYDGVVEGLSSWFYQPAGREHYRLLCHVSGLYSNATLLDVGTLCGSSAIALAHNKANRVISYDVIKNQSVDSIHEKNIEFRIGNAIECAEMK